MSSVSLAPHHRAMLLEESAITPETIEARGYHTVETKAELERLASAVPSATSQGSFYLYAAPPRGSSPTSSDPTSPA